MIERELEAFIRRAWTDSQTPLTDENVARLVGLPRADVEHGMRQLMRKGVVDMDIDAGGNIVWCVPGLKRAASQLPPAPSTETVTSPPVAKPVEVATGSAIVAQPAVVSAPTERRTAYVDPPKPPRQEVSVSVPGIGVKVGFSTDPERKSVLLSGGVSLLFGPFGWIYAAPWKEALPAIGIYTVLVALFPKFLVGTLLGVLHPTCGVLGMLYAFRHNQTKRRTPLLLVDKDVKTIDG